MGFDATKLVPGKCYPMRGGGKAEFLKPFIGSTGTDDLRLAWLRHFDDGTQMIFDSTRDGDSSKFIVEQSSMDIISDEPIKEPVELHVEKRYALVWKDGSIAAQYETLEQAMRHPGPHAGVYELPPTILVTPK